MKRSTVYLRFMGGALGLLLAGAVPAMVGIAVDIALGEQDVTVYGADQDDWLTDVDSITGSNFSNNGISDPILSAAWADSLFNSREDVGETYFRLGPFATGTELGFVSNRDAALLSGVNDELYKSEPDGSNPTNLTNDPAQDQAPTASRIGSWLAFTSTRAGDPFVGPTDIYRMRADGTGVENLTNDPHRNSEPVYSPNGSQIAFITTKQDAAGFWTDAELYVMDADGSNLRQLTTSPGAYEGQPAWSPDGQWIVFTRGAFLDFSGNSDIFVINANGMDIRQLTSDLASDRRPAWSPDGALVAFETNRTGNWEIFVMKPDGVGATNLTNHPTSDGWPQWAPQWASTTQPLAVAFVTNRNGSSDIYVQLLPLPLPPLPFDPARLAAPQPFAADPDLEEFDPTWAPIPNGEMAYVTQPVGDPEFPTEVFLLPGLGTDPAQPTNVSNAPQAFDFDPVWLVP